MKLTTIKTDTFLSTFAVPILPYILKVRMSLEGSNVQSSMSIVLSCFGLTMFILSPVAGMLIDNFSNRKRPLVISLVAQIIATLLTASSGNSRATRVPLRRVQISGRNVLKFPNSVYLLCFSRVFLGAAACFLWIASLASIADTVGSGNMGKTMGIIGPIVSSGAFFGPVTGGLLLSSVGYWQTWSVAILMISLDLILRLAMCEGSSTAVSGSGQMPSSEAQVNADSDTLDSDKYASAPSKKPSIAGAPSSTEEVTPLLTVAKYHSEMSPTKPLSNAGYFFLILRQRRVISSMLVSILLSMAYNSFNATLPLHVQENFHWGPHQVGLLFLALVGPSVLLGPPAGWLRDSVGVKWPAIVGTGLVTPSYILIGLAGVEKFHWMQGNVGKAIYIGALILVGIAKELTAGICIIEGTRKLALLCFLKKFC